MNKFTFPTEESAKIRGELDGVQVVEEILHHHGRNAVRNTLEHAAAYYETLAKAARIHAERVAAVKD